LCGSTATRLALAGATEAEIATITGHKIGDVRNILDKYPDKARGSPRVRFVSSKREQISKSA
jgi:hypothetical protein